MNPPERFTMNPKIVSETIDGEVIILNLDRGRYYSLTLAGTDTWASIGRGASGDEIVDTLLALYQGQRTEVEQAVQQLLDDLRREELILALPPGASGPVTPTVSASRASDAEQEHRPRFQPPVLQTYTDMEDLLLLDPIHEVDESGWPNRPADQAQSVE
jgi:hypothetical protein